MESSRKPGQNGKGDRPRPVDRDRYDANFDRIDWTRKNETIMPPLRLPPIDPDE